MLRTPKTQNIGALRQKSKQARTPASFVPWEISELFKTNVTIDPGKTPFTMVTWSRAAALFARCS